MKPLKNISLLMLMLVLSVATWAQDPVHFTVQQKQVSPEEVDLIFTAKIDKGWHLYSTNIPDGGPTRATINLDKKVTQGVEPIGKLQAKGKTVTKYEDMFEMNLTYFENSGQFVQRFKITGKEYKLKGYLEYGACNDEMCMPPTSVDFSYSGKGPADAPEAKPEEAVADSVGTSAADSAAVAVADSAVIAEQSDLWRPVIKELEKYKMDGSTTDRSLFYIFLLGLLGGLIALFTPCVWPIIPMTVSFFLKRAKDDKKKGIKDAITYGISIVVIYLVLGLAVTAIFGASALNALSTNAWFNIFFCLLLVVFALSFFGWFELTLPSSWTNKVDSKASSTSGLLSIFLMAFTLTLVSFSCTGPIIGFLLVDFATSGNFWGPAIGMLGFAIALALPFTLFALFPTWLKKSPKSGGWMNTLKVVLGFIELAFACKFFSVADLTNGWHLMDREVFLSLWIAIFGMLGAYLVGWLKFRSDETGGEINRPMPVVCIMLGLVSFAFTIYMIPGLWGAPCKAVSAFSPPINTQDFNLNTKVVEAHYTNYEEGMAAAAAQGKPVMIDSTGFGCVNCRKMEAAVWTDPTVADKLTKDYVLISLFVDDKTPLKEEREVTESDGKKRTLRTIGDLWSYLQRYKFGTNAQPFYVTVDNEGNPLSGSFVYKEDIPGFLEFLNKGLENYRK
ncbi:MAG: thioredoxin family protein [Prevotella sp.]|nr:thioredoxin family protein [Prevotella sp.]